MSGQDKKVVIVGSGIFGLSTAWWMLKKGGYQVTILDKSEVIPAPDAASTDMNKIIRSGDYADAEIAALNVDAVKMWEQPEWKGTYHESGVLMLGVKGTPSSDYAESSYQNVKRLGIPAQKLTTTEEIQACYPSNLRPVPAKSNIISDLAHQVASIVKPQAQLGAFENLEGYVNPHSGWAEASRACEVVIDQVKALGGKFLTGAEVTGMVFEENDNTSAGKRVVKGVKLASGKEIMGDLIVLAAGAWTPCLFAQPGMGGLPGVVSTGQTVAKIQLTPKEVKQYQGVPVTLDLLTGFYTFPPNHEGIMKLAIHGLGYVNTSNPSDPNSTNEGAAQSSGISCPRTVLTPGGHDGCIPREAVTELRRLLAEVYPQLAKEKDFCGTRLCWYTDTVNGDWIIDFHPEMDGVLLATAGSGHAFKFLPNIGREILAKVEGRLNPKLAHKWRFEDRSFAERDAATDSDIRGGDATRKVINIEELSTHQDLKAAFVPSKL